MGSWLGKLVLGSLEYVTNDVHTTLSQEIWKYFSSLFGSPIAVFDEWWVRIFMLIATQIAGAALGILIAYHAVRRMLESLDGTETLPAGVLLRRSITAGMTIAGVSLYGWLASTIADFVRDILAALPFNVDLLQFLFAPVGSTWPLATMLLGLVFLVGAVLVTIQRAVLNAEFTVLLIIGSLIALSRVGEDHPAGWQLWKREVVAIAATPPLQLLIIYLFAVQLGGGDSAKLSTWLEAFGLLYVLWNTPRWARNFTYSVGGGAGVGGTLAAVTAGTTRLAVMRMMLRR